MERFGIWLERELQRKGWTQNKLAMVAGLGSGTISNIISGNRKIGEETCTAIAKALRIPPEEVFRAAGLLPAKPDNDPTLDRLTNIGRHLSIEGREFLADIGEKMLERDEGKDHSYEPVRYKRTPAPLHATAEPKKP